MNITPDLLAAARALTLWRWWAYAITHYGKRVENRPWAPPESTDVVLIHAGTPRPAATEQADMAEVHRLSLRTGVRPVGAPLPGRQDLPTSEIVAVGRLAHVCDAGRRGAACGCGPWAATGQYHWVFGEVRALTRPVPARGFQKLWRPSPEVLDAVLVEATGMAVAR